MTRKVAVTGLGVVSPLGCTLDAFWQNLLSGEAAPSEFREWQPHYMKHRSVYQIQGLEAGCGTAGRASRYATAATAKALQDAGLDPQNLEGIAGVSLGTGTGDVDLVEDARAHLHSLPPLHTVPFRVAASVASHFGLTGPNFSVGTACAAGCYSISLARQAIADGRADVMVAGGTETISRVVQGCFNRMDALDPIRCRPFALDREGTVYGEGAAVLVLESEEHACRRGVTQWYGELKGEGWSCDGYHATAPDPSGRQPELALYRASTHANLPLDSIDCILAHGTGTALNDDMESLCLNRVFGAERLAALSVSALKSKLGHSGGAAGAFAALTACLILKHQLVPPVPRETAVDPKCSLNLVTDSARQARVRTVLISAYSFGGNNISMLIGKE